MIQRWFCGALLASWALLAQGSIPGGYYDSLEGKSGVSLKKAVKSVARNHTAISYGDDTWSVFLESDTHMVGSQRCWWDMYSNDNVAAPNAGSHGGLNIEHSVANSWWGGTKNDAYKDLMHLNPSNSTANNRKSNYPLGIVKTETWSNGVTFVGKPASGTCGGAQYVYEPADQYKGDFARAFFYMFTIYDDIAWKSDWDWMYDSSSDLLLKPWAYQMLLEWAKNDPVSQKEIDRNEVIYKHQKNRNPFIDCPELAEHIWGSRSGQPFHFNGMTEPDQPDDQPGDQPGNEPDNPDNPDNPALGTGYWYAVTSAADLNETDHYVILASDSDVAMSKDLGSSGAFFQPCGKTPGFDNSTTPKRLVSVPDDVAVITLKHSGAGWLMAVSTKNGEDLGYMKSTNTKNVTLTSNAGDNGTVASINPSSSKTTISYGSSDAKLEYNSSAPRFTTYTSGQEAIMLYRLEEEKPGTSGINTGTLENATEMIYGIYTIDGHKVAAEGISELPRGLYIIITNFGSKKIIK